MGGVGSELPGVGSSLAFSFLSLGVVCLAAFAVLRWLARKGVGHSPGAIRVLGHYQLEPRRSLYLVEAAGRCFLLGVGEGPIALIAELDRALLAESAAQVEAARGSFAGLLSRILRRRSS